MRKTIGKDGPIIAPTGELASVNEALKEIIAGQKRAGKERN